MKEGCVSDLRVYGMGIGGETGREQFELKGEAKRRVLQVEIRMDHPQGGNQPGAFQILGISLENQ